MRSFGGEDTLVRGALSDTFRDPRRIGMATIVLFVVVGTFSSFQYLSLALAKPATQLTGAPTELVSGTVRTFLVIVGLCLFALCDLTFVRTVLDEDEELRPNLERVTSNSSGTLLWVIAFVTAFWPMRDVLLAPSMTLLSVFSAIRLPSTEAGGFTSSLIVFTVGAGFAFFLSPITVAEDRSITAMLGRSAKLLAVTPLETSVSVVLGIGTLLGSVFFVYVTALWVVMSAALIVFGVGLVLLPFALLFLLLGLLGIPCSYAFSRSLLARTYRLGVDRLDDGRSSPGSDGDCAPAES